MQETEEFLNGFCKRQNQIRTVFCEFEVYDDGSRRLVSWDCDFGRCEHSRDCQLMKNAKPAILHPALKENLDG